MKFLSSFILRHAGGMFLLLVLTSLLGGFYSFKLFSNLRTDLEELLPPSARSVQNLNEITSRLASTTNLSVLVFSDDPAAARRFLTDLGEKLRGNPSEIVASVEYEVSKELQFFKSRGALFIDAPDLARAKKYIVDKIDYETELRNPINIFLNEELPEPKLDIPTLISKYEAKSSNPYSNLPGGWYSTLDQKVHVAIVNLAGKLSGIGSAKKLRHLVDQVIQDLNPKSYHPSLKVEFTGDVQNLIDEHEALMEDLVLSTVIVLFLVTAIMMIYYRNFWRTLLLVGSLVGGTLWSFGISFFFVGYLNANSAFLGSIILGNGVNFGIIFLARYLEERRLKLKSHDVAIEEAMVHTWKPTLTAALAAGFSYGSLMLTDFRGFSQFGMIGLIGMILCWISAYTLLPILLTIWEKFFPLKASAKPFQNSLITRVLVSLVEKGHLLWMGLSAVAVVASILILRTIDNKVIETDLTKLRSKKSQESGAMFYSKYVDQIFGKDLSPFIVLAKDREEARKIVIAFEKVQEEKKFPISQVLSLDQFLPTNQAQKITLLRQINSLLSPEIKKALGERDKKFVQAFLTPEVFHEFKEEDLPDLVIKRFTEKTGARGNLVLLEIPLGGDAADGDFLMAFVAKIREVADSVRPGLAITGSRAVTADLYAAVRRDGPRATGFAFISVAALLLLLFWRRGSFGLVLLNLCLGVLWMVAILLFKGWKINFLNFIALPITFGIGVDYAVNFYQRYIEEGAGSAMEVLRNTGGAVALASLTTATGYGSLLIASNQAFVSFGELAVLGEFTCAFSALILLPSFLHYRDQRKKLHAEIPQK